MDPVLLKHIDRSLVIKNSKVVDGFPRVDWESIKEWIRCNIETGHAQDALDEAAWCWLEATREHLGKPYAVYTSDRFYLLCPYEEEKANTLIWFAEDTRQTIRDYLQQIELEYFGGKRAILVFADQDTYYTYISYFYPEGHFGTSGGIQIRQGLEHLVLPHGALWQLEAVLTHELTHAVLSKLCLPQWLEEGLAQIMEELVLSRPSLRVDAEMKRKHDQYWHSHGLDKFWSGEVFQLPDEGQTLGYELAQILVRNMVVDHRDRFFDFVQDATSEDAGEAAAIEHLGCCVSDCAKQFLGDGDWAPSAEALRQAVERGKADFSE